MDELSAWKAAMAPWHDKRGVEAGVQVKNAFLAGVMAPAESGGEGQAKWAIANTVLGGERHSDCPVRERFEAVVVRNTLSRN